MPTYSFQCNKCDIEYDELTNYDESGEYLDVKCPECESEDKTKLISAPRSSFNKNSHSYRFGHSVEKAKDLRSLARRTQGDPGYNHIDDIKSGKHFGEVE